MLPPRQKGHRGNLRQGRVRMVTHARRRAREVAKISRSVKEITKVRKWGKRDYQTKETSQVGQQYKVRGQGGHPSVPDQSGCSSYVGLRPRTAWLTNGTM